MALRYAVLVPYCSDDELSGAKLFSKKERGEIKDRENALIGRNSRNNFFHNRRRKNFHETRNETQGLYAG